MSEVVSFEQLHPGLPALTLADAFLQMTDCEDPVEATHTRSAVLLVAEHLADTTGPLTWEEMEVAEFFRRIDFMPDDEKVGIAVVAVGFYGWMIFAGLIGGSEGMAVIQEIIDKAPESEILDQLRQDSLRIIPPMLPN